MIFGPVSADFPIIFENSKRFQDKLLLTYVYCFSSYMSFLTKKKTLTQGSERPAFRFEPLEVQSHQMRLTLKNFVSSYQTDSKTKISWVQSIITILENLKSQKIMEGSQVWGMHGYDQLLQ